jgi:hypothetical protein
MASETGFTIIDDRTHVASVRGRAVDNFRAYWYCPSKQLCHNSILRREYQISSPLLRRKKNGADLEISERYSMLWIMSLAKEQVPKSHLFRLDLELLYYRNDCLPPCDMVRRELKAGHIYGWKHFALEETK